MREEQASGRLAIRIEESTFELAPYRRFLDENADSIAAFRTTQQHGVRRGTPAWAAAGEFDLDQP